MTIKDAKQYFLQLKEETVKDSELKLYKKFTKLLSDLEKRNFPIEELSLIESKLERMKWQEKDGSKAKHFVKKYKQFLQFLSESFSLVPKGHYAALFMSFGISFGAAFGTAFGVTSDSNTGIGISIGISFGMIIGIIVGRFKEEAAKKENRLLEI